MITILPFHYLRANRKSSKMAGLSGNSALAQLGNQQNIRVVVHGFPKLLDCHLTWYKHKQPFSVYDVLTKYNYQQGNCLIKYTMHRKTYKIKQNCTHCNTVTQVSCMHVFAYKNEPRTTIYNYLDANTGW